MKCPSADLGTFSPTSSCAVSPDIIRFPNRAEKPSGPSCRRRFRLLITLLLCHDRVLSQPLLYLSLHLKQHRPTYYELLQRVRTEGAWEKWLEFFFAGVIDVAEEAAAMTMQVLRLFQEHQRKIAGLGSAAPTVARVHTLLQRHPMLSVNRARELLGNAPAFSTVNSAFSRLTDLGIVAERTGGARGRVFAYKAYLAALNEGTELPA